MKAKPLTRNRKYISFSRQRDAIPLRERFLIVCEGEQTEPNYFRAFRVQKDVKVVGLGYNTVSVVEEALRLKQLEVYDQVWCVFDRDSFPAKHFNDALALAKANGIEVAYSNEAFELWYLLHFNFVQSAMSRAQYVQKLSEMSTSAYAKNSKSMYVELLYLQKDAIRNAKKLLESYDPHNPEHDNPSTTVHLLVEQLNKQSVDSPASGTE
jgi:hypothetical protein